MLPLSKQGPQVDGASAMDIFSTMSFQIMHYTSANIG